MYPISLDDYYDNPRLQRRLFDEARNERRRAVRAGLDALRRFAAARLLPRLHLRPARWVERLG